MQFVKNGFWVSGLTVILLFHAIISNGQTNFNPSYSIGTVSGKYHYTSAQVPEQLVEIHPAGFSGQSFTYQWESSPTPFSVNDADWVTVSTQANFSFSQPLTQTTYYRRRAKLSTSNEYVYSNIIKINVVASNWEDLNYVRQYDINTSGMQTASAIDQLPMGPKLQSTNYLDGLGRSIQQVTREIASPLSGNGAWADLVEVFKYDVYGRQDRKYLPYSTTNDGGKFKSASSTEQTQYYSTLYNETTAFSSVSFDNTPLNRLKKVNDAGSIWAASIGKSASYDVNTDADNVHIFTLGYTVGNYPLNLGTYPANTLFKTTYTDEKGKQVVEFSNLSGQLILKKVQLDDFVSAPYAGWICTYSIYDDFGLLRCQIQPEGVKYLDEHGWSFSGQEGQTVFNEQCFQYYYDEKGRNIEKKAPGVLPLRIIYDKRDRIVFRQDGNQSLLSIPQWTANLYDDLDRPVLVGLYNTNTNISALRSDVAGAITVATTTSTPAQPISNISVINRDAVVPGYYATTSIEFLPGFTSNPGEQWTAAVDPNANSAAQSITVRIQNPIPPSAIANPAVFMAVKYLFYDDYSFTRAKQFNSSFTNTTAYSNAETDVLPIVASARTIDMATGVLSRVLGTDVFLGTTRYYDEKENLIQTLEDNIRSGSDITTIQYHFDRRVLSTCTDHSAPGTGYFQYKILSKNEFDKIGRISTISKKFGTNPLTKIATYSYDDFGRLKSKKLHPDYRWDYGNDRGIEILNYSYNINGQITGINKDYALKSSSAGKYEHFFGMYLGYDNKDNVFANANLNGQVTGIVWSSMGDYVQRKYDYSYDNAGRLLNASFTEQQHLGEGWTNSKMDFSVSGAGGKISYDLNGNLLSMQQKGVLPGSAAPFLVDNLAYDYYSHSNKLKKVSDLVGNTSQNGILGDFKDGVNTTDPDYVYDSNGNLVIDLNKNAKDINNVVGANGIVYNYLDKPEQIRIAGKGIIKITYSADGEKMERSFTPEGNGNIVTTSYVNEFVYQATGTQAPALTFINFEEGRLRIDRSASQQVSVTSSTGDVLYDYRYRGGQWDMPDGGYSGVFDFYLRDYQENVRAILTDQQRKSASTCTMETARAAAEETIFGQSNAAGNEVNITRSATPPGWQSINKSASVSKIGNIAGHNIGPNALQKVMAFDQIRASVQYYYVQQASSGTNPNLVNTVLSSLVQAIGGSAGAVSTVHSNAGNISSQLNGSPAFINAVRPQDYSPGGAPKAYLTLLFFDERFNLVSQQDNGIVQLRVDQSLNGTGVSTVVSALAPKNGYVYAYVSNESDQDVYFDDFRVEMEENGLLEEDHYYSFGLKIASLSSHAFDGGSNIKNNYLYNDKELFEEADLNWYDYGFRNYDPQIGRFVELDPLTDDFSFLTPYQYASDDPITNIDLDGLEGLKSVGGIASDFFQGSKTILQGEVVVVAIKASKPVQNSVNLAKVASLSMHAIKLAAIVVRAQQAAKTLNHFSSAPEIKAQIKKAVEEFAASHLELDESDIFTIGVKTNNYYKGLNLMAWWAKGDFEKLDRTVIRNESGNLTDDVRVQIAEEGIRNEQRGIAGILKEGANVGLFISGAGLFPSVGTGPKGSMLKYKTPPQAPRAANGEMNAGEMLGNFGIPKLYTYTSGGKTVFVSPHAMKHLEELAANGVKLGPNYLKLLGQTHLKALHSAIDDVLSRGAIQYRKMYYSGGNEIMFGAPRAVGELPAVIHFR